VSLDTTCKLNDRSEGAWFYYCPVIIMIPTYFGDRRGEDDEDDILIPAFLEVR
jgi:hypothetical protein